MNLALIFICIPFPGDLSRQVREMATVLNNREEQRVELCTKHGHLVTSFENQCQELKATNRRVQSLQSKLDQLEQLQDELRTEVGFGFAFLKLAKK